MQIRPAHTNAGDTHDGFAYGSLGRNQEAIIEYQKQLTETPDNPRVLYDFGHCLLETGDPRTAVIHLRKSTELDPQNADAFYDLGKGLLLNGETDRAISTSLEKTRLSVLSIAARMASAIGIPAATIALRMRQNRSMTEARTTSRITGIRNDILLRRSRPGSDLKNMTMTAMSSIIPRKIFGPCLPAMSPRPSIMQR